MIPSNKRKGLGRGLDTLISMDDVPASGSSAINEIQLSCITPNPDQPRTTFDEEALQDLASSIRELGIIQPLSLRKVGEDSYQIIAGERRYRAAKLAGLETVPAYVREASDLEMTEMALIENIQREDLNAIEIALTYKKLIEQYGLTQERLSERVGRNRTTIANFLRLLKLPANVQLGLRDKLLDMGHARALLSLTDPTLQLKLYNDIITNGLSVRRVEELAREWNMAASAAAGNEEAKPQKKSKSSSSASEYEDLRQHLCQSFKTEVQFACNKQGKGKITFSFDNEDQLQQLIFLFDKIKP